MIFAATLLQTWNTILNVIAVALPVVAGVYFGPKYLRMRDAQAQLEEKDRTIATHEQSMRALTERVEVLEEQVEECRSAAADAKEEAAAWKGRYEAQHEFTAEPALVAVRAAIGDMKSALKVVVEAQGELLVEEMRQTRVVLDQLARGA